MRRDLERRLLRAEIDTAAVSWVDRQKAEHREDLRLFVKLQGLIRERLQEMGFDPQLTRRLQDLEAAAELAAIPDTPDLRAADEAILRADRANRGDLGREFEAKVLRIAERYRSDQHQLDLASASLIELFAFCVAVEMEADEFSASADKGQHLAMANTG
jgi:hypothetical protein